MSQFLKEVLEQSNAIRETVRMNRNVKLESNGKPFLFTGMGSSLAASELLVSYLHSNGVVANAVDTSELLHYHKELLRMHQLVVVSQSGESVEAKELISLYKDAQGITNTKDSFLANHVQNVFFTYAGEEKAIASSKSFTATAALMLLLGALSVNRDMSTDLLEAADILQEELKNAAEYQKEIANFLNPEKPLILLGRGPSVFTAKQGALTLKETARMFTEAMSAAQFRHGPFELLKEEPQVIFFNPYGITYDLNRNYVLEMADLGAKVLYVSDEPLIHDHVKSFMIRSVNEFVSVIPYTLITQLAAVELSGKRGLTAGEAQLISKVTRRQ